MRGTTERPPSLPRLSGLVEVSRNKKDDNVTSDYSLRHKDNVETAKQRRKARVYVRSQVRLSAYESLAIVALSTVALSRLQMKRHSTQFVRKPTAVVSQRRESRHPTLHPSAIPNVR